jgi:hypothetical protein
VFGPIRPVRAAIFPLLEYSFPESHSRRAGIGHVHLLGAYPYLLVNFGTAYSLAEFATLVKKYEGVDREAKRHPYEPFTLPTLRKIVDALTVFAKTPAPAPASAPAKPKSSTTPKRTRRPVTGDPRRQRTFARPRPR